MHVSLSEPVHAIFKQLLSFLHLGPTSLFQKDEICFYQYLEYLMTNLEDMDSVERFAKGYEDYLQAPLQPLMDNLESQVR